MDRAQTECVLPCSKQFANLALERLIESGDHSSVRRAHAAYCLVLAEKETRNWAPQIVLAGLRNVTLRSITSARLSTGCFRHSTLTGVCVSVLPVSILGHARTPERGPCRIETVSASAARSVRRERADYASSGPDHRSGRLPGRRVCSASSLSLYEELGDESGHCRLLECARRSRRDRGDYASRSGQFEP